MIAKASPWDALLNPAAHKQCTTPAIAPSEASQAQPESKLATVLAEMARHHSITTAALANAVDMTTKTIWGLLRLPRDRGQVTFDEGKWALAQDYHGADVMRAAELLRSKGWTVTKPAATKGAPCAT